MPSIHTWIAREKNDTSTTQIVFLGNEAADLDSMASSIAYGYLRSLQDPQLSVLPVMPIPRADFILRTEAVFVFTQAHIDIKDVVFFDEVDFDQLMDQSQLTLVDHNKLAGELERYSPQVVSILDHHKDEGLYSTAKPRIIEPVGSTATLVIRGFSSSAIEIDPDTAILLAGTILLDTVNLSDEAGRTTAADREAVDQVLPLCPLARQDYFDQVQKEKFNVTGLSTHDLLRKDYKEWQLGSVKCGIGSALLPVSSWAERDSNLVSGFAAFAAQRGLDLLLSMNAYTAPDFQRDLIVYSQSKADHDRVFDFLQEKKLSLTPLECNRQQSVNNGFISCYTQGNLGISRKKMQPLLADLFKR